MNIRALIYRLGFPLAKIAWFFTRPKTKGVKCIIEYGDEWLMIRNTYGSRLWTFSGGGTKKDETALMAAKRELKEELDIEMKRAQGLGKFVYKGESVESTVSVFKVFVDDKNFRIDPSEVLEARWFKIQNLPVDGMGNSAKIILSRYG